LNATSIEDGLAREAAITLVGSRRTGKTTLALHIGETRPSIYLKNRICRVRGLNALEIPAGENLLPLWLRGGFPRSYLAAEDTGSYLRRQILSAPI